jgi:hypothetical protein
MYEAEIWGWKVHEEVEKVQEKYLRGVLGVDRVNTRVHSEGRVQEEQAESESGKERCKVRRQKWMEGKSGRMLTEWWREKKNNKEEREKYYQRKQIC